MIALNQANNAAIDRKGKAWGVPNLARLLQGGGAVVGAVLGGFGGSMITRHADQSVVDDLQSRLASARTEAAGR